MEQSFSSTLANVFGKPVSLLSSGRFDYGGLLPGAWLAAYNPLDGAFLLTTDPPEGFIGAVPGGVTPSLEQAHITFNFTNLSGIDLMVELRPSFPSPKLEGVETPLHIFMASRNHTNNPLPISLAFSWQDLSGKPPLGCTPEPQGLAVLFGGGSRIRAVCSYPHTRFSYCTGWNPAGNGEEVWDDYFAYGELSGQQYTGAASAVCAHALVAPEHEFILNIKLEPGGAV